ncbi:5-formyltetrahydrofolate cyclo-ligase family protein [Caloranaerobacter azorensis DSM 13643]|uniref:5-formyltetrahydrofolate cyclo-ligase family protein n=1 Tax=Caloranaerobacter azorensis DSM 13643 TaxID=1121264 RepID=A0A1M5R3U7_9FIRM|nr:5-formyltetrahydrofolate cyclo-ligase [Caloranaerobacter azorensis]SHH21002.1 5-formyltetrahydrofolate cyclo-ligase family protein [Caloranaerobacter azorensis DSM 13643]
MKIPQKWERKSTTLRDKSVPKVALAFDFQVVEKIDEEKHDIPVDYIITEKGVRTV